MIFEFSPRSFSVLATAVLFLLSCKVDPDPAMVDDSKTCRGFAQKTENVEIRMPKSTVFISEDVSSDLLDYDQQSGTITFSKSKALDSQRIKEGDILYSTERSEKTPNGYCLRVLGITKNGNTVTFQTEPASALEAIDYLNETGVMTAGNYRPEDVKVYMLPIDESDGQDTKAGIVFDEGINIEGEKFDFHSDAKDTSFGFVVFEDKENTLNSKESFKVKLTVNLHHEVDDDKSSLYIEDGNFILFAQMNIGIGLRVDIGTKMSLEHFSEESTIGDDSGNNPLEKIIEDKAKAALVGKRFRLFEIPLNWTASNILFSPKIVFYGEFKLDFSGKLVVETGIQNGIYALNIANNGPWSTNFKELTYFRKVSHFSPYFRMSASLNFEAAAGLGAGFVCDFPFLPVTDKNGNTVNSYVGIFIGLEMTQSVSVEFEKAAFSGETKVTAKGSDGNCSIVEDVEVLVGLKKAVKAEASWRLFEIPLFEIPGWEWPIYVSTPAPFNLQSRVQGAYTRLSWTHPKNLSAFNETRVYVDYSIAGDAITAYKTNYNGTEVDYGPAEDGSYRWRVENRALDGSAYSSPTESFEISNSYITTGTPVREGDGFKIPVTLSTINEVRSKGVVYSSQYSEPSPDTDKCVEYNGNSSSFSITIDDLFSGLTYYARSYAYIKKNGGWFKIYGDVVRLRIDPPKMTIEPTGLDFGDVQTGNSKYLPIKFTNDGGRDLVISSITCADGFYTPLREGNQLVVAPGETRGLNVTFKPEEERPYSGTMIIKSNASGNQTAVVKLSGNGIPPALPKIAVSPSALVFDPIVAGKGYYEDLPITITNTGNAPLTISSIEFRGSGSPFSVTGTKPQRLDKGASATVSVRFKPSEPGVFSNTLAVVSDASNASTISVTVKGEGVRGRPDKMIKTVSFRTDSPRVYNKDVSVSVVYDNQERPMRLDADDGKGNRAAIKYGYSGDRITVSAYGSSEDYYLDGNGRVSASSNRNVKFRYDSYGRLSSIDINTSDSQSISYKWSGDDIYRIIPQYADDEYYDLNSHYDASEYYAPLRGADLNSLIRLMLYEIGDEFGDGRIFFDNGEFFTITGLAGKRSDHMLSLQFSDYKADANEMAYLCCKEYRGADGNWHPLDPFNWSEGYGTFAVRGSGALSAVKCKPWAWSADADGAVTRAVWKQVHTTSGITGNVTVSKGSWDRDGDGRIDGHDAEFSFSGCNFRSSSDKEYNFIFSFSY